MMSGRAQYCADDGDNIFHFIKGVPLVALLHQIESSLREEDAKLAGIVIGYLSKAIDELEDIRQRLRETTERLAKYKDNLDRTTVPAPMDGIVKTLYLVTIGGVLKPGGAVLDLVPLNDKLVIEARLPIQDVGYISPDQQATIRLASNDASRFSHIQGKVVAISPDTLISDNAGAFVFGVIHPCSGLPPSGAASVLRNRGFRAIVMGTGGGRDEGLAVGAVSGEPVSAVPGVISLLCREIPGKFL